MKGIIKKAASSSGDGWVIQPLPNGSVITNSITKEYSTGRISFHPSVFDIASSILVWYKQWHDIYPDMEWMIVDYELTNGTTQAKILWLDEILQSRKEYFERKANFNGTSGIS